MDEDIRGLERRVAAGEDDAVEDLQRAYLRGGHEVDYLNLVISTMLDRTYYGDGELLRIHGPSIYEVASAESPTM